VSALRALERFARAASEEQRSDHAERCEVCAAYRLASHSHVVDRSAHKLCCVCGPCSVAFQGTLAGRYVSVPTRVAVDPTFCLTNAQWETLQIPVRLAFVLRQSGQERWVAFFPSPAGATEAELSQSAWLALTRDSTLVRLVRDDVEALLMRGNPSGTFDCFITPIDLCYELVGIVRKHWRGFSGGEQVQRELDRFFNQLNARSEIVFDKRASYRSRIGGKSGSRP
jgi:hypothetical protein